MLAFARSFVFDSVIFLNTSACVASVQAPPGGGRARRTLRIQRFLAGIAFVALLLMSSHSDAEQPNHVHFSIKNETGEAVSVTVRSNYCIYVVVGGTGHWGGSYALPRNIPNGEAYPATIEFFRDASASACSGVNGAFDILVRRATGGSEHALDFRTTDGGVWESSSPGGYAGTLTNDTDPSTPISSGDSCSGSCTVTLRDEDSRLAKPADARLR